MCTAFVPNFASAAVVRFLLGVFEAGVLPGIAVSQTNHERY
jgi:hypothetical protein